MFGTLRPSLCKVSKANRQAYRRAYCGTCKALGEGYGQLARPLLSFDVVFLASVIESTRSTASDTATCRCPLLPVLQKPILSPASVSMQVAAAVQVVLASAWLEDQVTDGSVVYRPALSWSKDKARAAHKVLGRFGVDMGVARGLSERQLALEAQTREVRELAAPTSDLLTAVLQAVPDLPDSIPMAEQERETLACLGREIGVSIYAIDALEDLEDDVQRGAFNPCIDASGKVVRASVERCVVVLEQSLENIESLFASLEILRDDETLLATLRGLRQRANKAIVTGTSTLQESKQLRRRHRVERAIRFLGRALVWLPYWFLGLGPKVARQVRQLSRPTQPTCVAHRELALEPASLGSGIRADASHVMQSSSEPRPHKDNSGSSGPCSCCGDCCDCFSCCSCCDCCDSCGSDGGCCDCCSCDCCSCDC